MCDMYLVVVCGISNRNLVVVCGYSVFGGVGIRYLVWCVGVRYLVWCVGITYSTETLPINHLLIKFWS